MCNAFLSYAREDTSIKSTYAPEFVDNLCTKIKDIYSIDYKIFLDTGSIQSSDFFKGVISAALTEATFFIPLVTPSYFKSEWCMRELGLFWEQINPSESNKFVLPIYLETTNCMEKKNGIKHKLAEKIHFSDWRSISGKVFHAPAVSLKMEEVSRIIISKSHLDKIKRRSNFSPDNLGSRKSVKNRQSF